MSEARGRWALAGVVAALLGFGLSELAAGAVTLEVGPLLGLREAVIAALPPEYIVHNGVDLVAIATGPLLVILIVLGTTGLAAATGLAASDGWRTPAVVTVLVGAVGVVLVLVREGTTRVDFVPVLAGVLGFAAALALVGGRRARPPSRSGPDDSDTGAPDPEEAGEAPALGSRRAFLVRSGLVGVAAVAAVVAGEVIGQGRRVVERGRDLLKLTMVTPPQVPAGAQLDVVGISSWMTPNEEFYRVDSALIVPTIDAEQWQLRIHGEVENEVLVSYTQLIEMTVAEEWLTLVSLQNEAGGDLVGNAWWSGVPTRVLLGLAGVLPGADAVVQTGRDGWSCVTSTQALGDPRRGGLLAFAMNGEPLPLEHGYPARTIVPGLYGAASACKWVVDWEVTRLDVVAETREEDPALLVPVRPSSRIEVPAPGSDVPPGIVELAGSAWAPPQGVSSVEVAVDDGDWQLAVLGTVREHDAWVQWRAAVDLEPGEHVVRARARDRVGNLQDEADPEETDDATTGLHEVTFTVTEA